MPGLVIKNPQHMHFWLPCKEHRAYSMSNPCGLCAVSVSLGGGAWVTWTMMVTTVLLHSSSCTCNCIVDCVMAIVLFWMWCTCWLNCRHVCIPCTESWQWMLQILVWPRFLQVKQDTLGQITRSNYPELPIVTVVTTSTILGVCFRTGRSAPPSSINKLLYLINVIRSVPVRSLLGLDFWNSIRSET